ncbi:M20/M25/M40 family metallo-hydrolase [Parapedobacter sp. DT-150]|uniref:M20/M25/M40 family metallo-hydrolase n=1 Tax=Parapedobacter sp. DT-150 TaxID=3396162 RepID=UPI003F1CBBC6
MKKLIFFSCLYLLTGQEVWAQEKPTWETTFRQINAEVLSHSEAYTRLGESIQQIGHRLTGSPNGAKAEQYAFDLLKSYGFTEVSFQPFAVNGWAREKLDLRVGSPTDMQPMKAVALASTPASAHVAGELVDMGNGLESDYAADPEKVRGKIVLAALHLLPNSPEGTSNLHRSAKAALAIKYGAKGIILFNSVAGGTLLTGTASITGDLLTIPALCVGLEDGNMLKARIAQGRQEAAIEMTNKAGKMTARNVVARITGSELPHEKIVVGGHLDSWDLAEGAVDNGLGAFAILDMARTFIALGIQPKRTIEFVLFMGEEQGLLGSKAYVQQALREHAIDQIRFMLNFDMTNDPKSYHATLEESKGLFEAIGRIASATDTTFKGSFSANAGLYSDHQPFMLQGIPTGGAGGSTLSREALNCYHADCDVFDLVNEAEMKNTVRFCSMLIYGLADADEIPVNRLSDAEVKQLMLDNNLEEALRLGGDWRWD